MTNIAKKTSLLFTAGGSPGNEAIWRNLHNKYDLYFADMNADNIHPIIPRDHCFNIPKATDDNFVDEMMLICQAKNIDLFIPGVDEELLPIADKASEFLPTKLFMPGLLFISQMLDKYEMFQVFTQHDLPVPLTILANGDINLLSFPVIVKPRQGRGSRGISIISTKEKLYHCIRMLEGNPENWIIQDKFDGDEYTVQVLTNTLGSINAIIPILVHEKRGSTVNAETNTDPDIIALCKHIHSEFSAHGCYNVQLIKCSDGSLKVFEINPRISTTFCLSLELGLDPFEYFLSNAEHDSDFIMKKNVKLMRHWANTVTNIYI